MSDRVKPTRVQNKEIIKAKLQKILFQRKALVVLALVPSNSVSDVQY